MLLVEKGIIKRVSPSQPDKANGKDGKDMRIGEKIKNAREDLDLSQEDVARRIPMNQSGYSKIERDVQEPSLEQLRRICQILRLDPSYLLSLGEHGNAGTEDLRFAKEIKKLYKRFFGDSN